jgi:polyhydroxyalkanoate synthesis regulator phasin
MAPSEQWKQYLQAGMEVTEVTRQRAEKLVRDLVKSGEVQAHEAQQRVEELIDRSRKTTEAFAERVRTEVQRQMEALGLVQPAQKTVKKTASTAKKTAKKTASTAKKTAKKTAGAAKKAAGSS